MPMADRVVREQAAYNDGKVWEESHKIHNRFHHVFLCSNTLYGERIFEEKLAEYCLGNTVLDLGCWEGLLAPKYKDLGASKIIGIDISDRAIDRANRAYGDIGQFHVCDAHDLSCIGDEEVDCVVGRAILHHLDFERALREVSRVLRVGGTALFVEPLFDNPASMLFRAVTPQARTTDERPLSRIQIEWADRLFKRHEHHFCNLISTPVAMLTSIMGLPANNRLLTVADRFDRKLEATGLRYWMRVGYLTWRK